MYAAASQSASSSFGAMHASQQAMQEVEARTRLFIDNIISPNSTTEAINVDYLKQPVIEGLYQESCYKLQKWQQSQGSASGVYDSNVVAVFSLAVAVAFTIATGGVGSPLLAAALGAAQGGVVAAAAAASICQLTTQAALSLARTGDPLVTGKELLSDKSLRDLAVTAVSAGAIKGLSGYLKVSTQPHNFTEQALYHLLKAGVNTAAQTTIGGQDFKDTWKANMFRAAVDTATGTAANKIGEAYKGDDPTLNYITHKIAHGALGAGMGALLSDDRTKGAITGAIAGVISEMIGEYQADQLQQQAQGREINDAEFVAKQDQAVLQTKLVTALTACLASQDASLASQIAENAVANNSFGRLFAKALKQLMSKGGKEAVKKTGKEAAKKTGEQAAKQEAKESAKNNANASKLRDQLAKEQQAAESGRTFAESKPSKGNEFFRDAQKYADQYGGHEDDWVKKSSTNFRQNDTTKFETHWVENIKTGQKIDFKIKEVIVGSMKK